MTRRRAPHTLRRRPNRALLELVLPVVEAGPTTAPEVARAVGITAVAAHGALWKLAQLGCCRRAGRLASPAGGRPRTLWEVEP